MEKKQNPSASPLPTGLSSPAVYVFDRSANSHRETCSPWSTTHEAHSMTFQKQLEGSVITRKGHSYRQVFASSSEMVTGGRHCASRPTITLTKAGSADLYKHIKRRVAQKEFQDLYSDRRVLGATNNTTVVSNIKKKRGIGGLRLCPSMEDPNLMYQQTGYSQKPDTFQAG